MSTAAALLGLAVCALLLICFVLLSVCWLRTGEIRELSLWINRLEERLFERECYIRALLDECQRQQSIVLPETPLPSLDDPGCSAFTSPPHPN
jgi:hypothetical protein